MMACLVVIGIAGWHLSRYGDIIAEEKRAVVQLGL